MRHTAAVPAARLAAGFGQSGDVGGFEELVRRYSGFVYAVCYRVTANRHDAEDATQIAFLQLAIALKSGSTIERPAAWLERVARRQALRTIRTKSRLRRRERIVSRSEVQTPNHMEAMDQSAIAGVVRDQLDTLPERYRLPMVLHYFGAMSVSTIAAELKLSAATVSTRLHRGRKMLADQLETQGMKFDASFLTLLLTTAVPALVAQTIASGVSSAPIVPTGLAAGIISTVQLALGSAIRRPLMAAIVVGVTTASSIGLVVRHWPSELPRISLPNVVEWVQRLFTRNAPGPRAASDVTPPAAVEPKIEYSLSPLPFSFESNSQFVAPAFERSTKFASLPHVSPAKAQSDILAPPTHAIIERAPTKLVQSVESVVENLVANARVSSPRAHRNETISAPIISTKPLDLNIAAIAGSTQHHTQTGGTFEANRLSIGGRGHGEYHLNAGTISASELIIRETINSFGKLRGHGYVNVGERFVQNGRVVADGKNQRRSLDLRHSPPVQNTIENKPDESNGWYAVDGGKLDLPPQHVSEDRTYTFGESANDPTLDLVNSVRLTARNVSTPGDASISLLTLSTNPDEFASLPAGWGVVGFWEFDRGALDADAFDFTVRYNHVAADYLPGGDRLLTFLTYDGDWSALAFNLVDIDLKNRIIEGTLTGDFSHFAVAGPLDLMSVFDDHPRPRGGNVPEPAMAVVIVVFGLSLMRFRREGVVIGRSAPRPWSCISRVRASLKSSRLPRKTNQAEGFESLTR